VKVKRSRLLFGGLLLLGAAYLAATHGVRWWVDTRLAAAHERTVDLDLPLADGSGKRIASAELRGKTVVLSFFRSQCGGCQQERDAIVALAARLDPAKAQLVSVMMDAVEGYPPGVTAATLRRMDYRHPVVMADAEFVEQFQGTAWAHVTPVTWILDGEGRIVRHLRGHQTLAALLAALPEGAARG
jgi:peroxiredoxin